MTPKFNVWQSLKREKNCWNQFWFRCYAYWFCSVFIQTSNGDSTLSSAINGHVHYGSITISVIATVIRLLYAQVSFVPTTEKHFNLQYGTFLSIFFSKSLKVQGNFIWSANWPDQDKLNCNTASKNAFNTNQRGAPYKLGIISISLLICLSILGRLKLLVAFFSVSDWYGISDTSAKSVALAFVSTWDPV